MVGILSEQLNAWFIITMLEIVEVFAVISTLEPELENCPILQHVWLDWLLAEYRGLTRSFTEAIKLANAMTLSFPPLVKFRAVKNLLPAWIQAPRQHYYFLHVPGPTRFCYMTEFILLEFSENSQLLCPSLRLLGPLVYPQGCSSSFSSFVFCEYPSLVNQLYQRSGCFYRWLCHSWILSQEVA